MTQLETNTLRRGRPRRQGVARHAHGDIDWRKEREDPSVLPAWNKGRDLLLALGRSPRLSTQRGMLFCTRQLTELEFEAANRWSEMLETNDRIVLGARRSPASPAFERTAKGDGIEYDPERIERFKSAFDAAHKVLLVAGKNAENAVNKLCRNETSGATLGDAKRGLSLLIPHFGLVKMRKRS